MKVKASEVLSSNTADLWIDDEGVLWYEIFKDAQETMEDVLANLENATRLTNGEAAPVLYDMRAMIGIDNDVLKATTTIHKRFRLQKQWPWCRNPGSPLL